MSMFDDVLGFGRTSVMESMSNDALEPEIAGMTLEEAADIDEDPMDFMLRVAYENEMNMMNLDAAIVAEEYLYLRENGQEMVTEAGKLESIVNRAKDMITRLWNRIQSFFKTTFKKIEDALKLDKRFIEKYKNKVEGKYALVKGTTDLLDPQAIAKSATDIMKAIKDLASDEVQKASVTKNAQFTEKDAFKEKLVSKISNGKSKDTEDSARAAMKGILKNYKGDKNADPIRVSATNAITGLEKALESKRTIKAAYDDNKKAINQWLKDLKKLETSLKKFKIIPTEMSKNVHKSVKNLNMAGSALTLVDRQFIKAINMSRSFCKAAIVQAASRTDERTGMDDDPDSEYPNHAPNESSLIESFELL